MEKICSACAYSYNLYVNFFVWKILLLQLIFFFFFGPVCFSLTFWKATCGPMTNWPFSAKCPERSVVLLLSGAPALLIKLIPLLDLKISLMYFFLISFFLLLLLLFCYFLIVQGRVWYIVTSWCWRIPKCIPSRVLSDLTLGCYILFGEPVLIFICSLIVI